MLGKNKKKIKCLKHDVPQNWCIATLKAEYSAFTRSGYLNIIRLLIQFNWFYCYKWRIKVIKILK